MADRRYTEEEVAAIYARATELQNAAPRLPAATTQGMSLAEVQSIGAEAGIPAEYVAEAARALDRPDPPRDPQLLGLTYGVSHTVELGRKMSDAEWERFVVDLRETFDAKGKVTAEGSFRTWSNGNLHVMLEPTDDGHRVRFRTLHGNSRAFLGLGTAAVVFAAIVSFGSAIMPSESLAVALTSMSGIAMVGVGMFASAALRLPGWAKLRRQQMQRLGAKLLAKPLPSGE